MGRRNVYDDVDNSDYAGYAEILYKCCYTAMVTNCKCGHPGVTKFKCSHNVRPRRRRMKMGRMMRMVVNVSFLPFLPTGSWEVGRDDTPLSPLFLSNYTTQEKHTKPGGREERTSPPLPRLEEAKLPALQSWIGILNGSAMILIEV